MTNNRVSAIDRWIWVIVIVLAAAAAFVMMKRDVVRKFGAVSYGMFPQFHLQDQAGKAFDFHNLKGHAWAVRFSAPGDAKIAADLERIALATASGKKRLYLLTLADEASDVLQDQYHYTVSGPEEDIVSVYRQLGSPGASSIILVDQNSAIRGVYNLADVDDLHRLHQSLIGLL